MTIIKCKHITAVIIRRSNDENTVALVAAEVDPEKINTPDDLYRAVSKAVTAWARDTEAGRELKKSNNGDINVGDLADGGLSDDEELAAFLQKWGVHDMHVESHAAAATRWAFDDNLSANPHGRLPGD